MDNKINKQKRLDNTIKILEKTLNEKEDNNISKKINGKILKLKNKRNIE